jgi:hypothetical protein
MHPVDSPLPCAVGLIAATMSLMTMHSMPEAAADGAAADAATLRRLIERKIVSNLLFLQQHPDLPPGLRQVACQLRQRWAQPVAEGADAAPVPATALH